MKDFLEAFINCPHEVLGKKLKPFSLTHCLYLEAIDSPFMAVINGGEAHITCKDLELAVLICSSDDPLGEISKAYRLGNLPMKLHSFKRGCTRFLSYLTDFVTVPELWDKTEEKASLNAPWILSIINYRRDGMVSSVKDRSGKTIFAFEYHKDQKHLKSIKTYEGVYNFEYHSRKSSDILSKDNFYGTSLLLSKIEYPGEDAKVETLDYSRSMSRPRSLLLKDLNEMATSPLTVNKMSIGLNGDLKGWIEWCAATGIIMSDNGGEYCIGNDKYDSFFPNFKPGQGNAKFSAIKYKKPEMPYSQIYFFDFDNYYEIIGDSSTGEILRKSKIGACGPLKLNTRRVEKLVGSLKDDVWSLVKSNSFDNKGRLIRTIDGNSNVREYFYDKKFGGLTRLMENGVLKHSNKFSDSGKLIEEITIFDGVEIKKIISLSGDFEEEYKDGKMKRRLEYANGEIIKTILYDDNGESNAFDSIHDLLNFN